MEWNSRTITSVALAALSVLLIAGLLNPASAVCARATLAEPLVLPDGSSHPGGELTLCVHRDYSPVASLHETYVDGHPIGLLISRRGVSEGNSRDRPFMMFHRDRRGRLHLYGYATPVGQRWVTYLLGQQPGTQTPSLARAGSRTRKVSEVSTVLLTARAD